VAQALMTIPQRSSKDVTQERRLANRLMATRRIEGLMAGNCTIGNGLKRGLPHRDMEAIDSPFGPMLYHRHAFLGDNDVSDDVLSNMAQDNDVL
jgi:hypothetical protein